MRIISARGHGVLDYLVAAALLAGPNLLDFEPVPATVLRVFCGIAILYSVFTDYELGLFELLSSRIHLRIDFVWGLLLAASPWLLGFGDETGARPRDPCSRGTARNASSDAQHFTSTISHEPDAREASQPSIKETFHMSRKKISKKDPVNTRKAPTGVGRGKNAAGQSNGQFERDQKHGHGNFTGAGDPPRMTK